MISEVSIKNFKSLRDVRVKLERFTVFVGANASGKSSILQALDLLCRSADRRVGYDGNVLQQWASHNSQGGVELASESQENAYRCYFPPRPSKNGTSLGFGHPHQQGSTRDVATNLTVGDWKPWIPDQEKSDPLPRSMLLRLEASKLIPASVGGPDRTAMSADGTGLHPALTSMALNDPDSWQALQTDLRAIISTIRRLRHSKVDPGQVPPVLFDTLGASGLSASDVSEGTLLVLGLLTSLYSPSRPNLILLDDMDRGLHPRAQRDLIGLLRTILSLNPELQIVATTHSPYMLDCMEPDEVRMTCLRDDGSTACDSLPHHPKFKKWKDEMDPGEMWSLFGEEWVVEAGVAG